MCLLCQFLLCLAVLGLPTISGNKLALEGHARCIRAEGGNLTTFKHALCKTKINRSILFISGEMPYTCEICSKTFTFQQSYHKHLLYHNDDKPHMCNTCGRAFKELSTLHNHERIHSGIEKKKQN